jgi:hypothetical protein
VNSVFPVKDYRKLCDDKGNVLPDAFLMREGSTIYDLAGLIHKDYPKRVKLAIDARSGLRLPVRYQIRDRDIISLICDDGDSTFPSQEIIENSTEPPFYKQEFDFNEASKIWNKAKKWFRLRERQMKKARL